MDAIKRLPLRESQIQPVLVVFEDLHWIDAETQALLDRLIESLPRHACCFDPFTREVITTDEIRQFGGAKSLR